MTIPGLRLSAQTAAPTAAHMGDLTAQRADAWKSPLFAALNGRIMGMTGNAIVLDDGTGSLWIYSDDRTVSAGDRVEVWCTVWNNNRYGSVFAGDVRRMTVLEHGNPPSPIPATVAEILVGRHRLRVARTRGVVTDVLREEIDPRCIDFVIETESQRLIAILHDAHAMPLERFRSLIDKEVSVTGIVKPPPVGDLPFTDSEPSLALRSADDIEAVASPSIAPDRHPHRQTFSGTVVSPCGSKAFFLASTNGPNIRVKALADEPRVTAGQNVTVSGFARRNRYMAWLENARVSIRPDDPTTRPTRPRPAPSPSEASSTCSKASASSTSAIRAS